MPSPRQRRTREAQCRQAKRPEAEDTRTTDLARQRRGGRGRGITQGRPGRARRHETAGARPGAAQARAAGAETEAEKAVGDTSWTARASSSASASTTGAGLARKEVPEEAAQEEGPMRARSVWGRIPRPRVRTERSTRWWAPARLGPAWDRGGAPPRGQRRMTARGEPRRPESRSSRAGAHNSGGNSTRACLAQRRARSACSIIFQDRLGSGSARRWSRRQTAEA